MTIPDSRPRIIGPMIKKARMELDLSQIELARKLGYQYGNFIGMIESGASKFPREKVIKFAEALNIEPNILIKAWIDEYEPDWLDYLTVNIPE